MQVRNVIGQPTRLGALEKLPTTELLLDLSVVLALISVPLVPDFPFVFNSYLAAIYGLNLVSSTNLRLRNLHWLPPFFMLIGIVLVLKYYRTLVGYEAGIALYTVLMGAKLLEVRKLRDCNVTVIIALFLIVLQFLLNQSLARSLYMLPLVVALFAILIQGNRVTPLPRGAALKIALQTVGQALPMMVIIFVLFPRLAEPLWALTLKLDRLNARTGLSDTMAPGSINELMRSPAVAFRAELQQSPLPGWLLYWRGPVFWHTLGLSWSRGLPKDVRHQPLQNQDGRIDYRIIMEPNGKRWVLALDLPTSAPQNTELRPDFQILNKEPIDQRSQFFLTSYTNYNTGMISPLERTLALQIPGHRIGKRLRDLAREWQNQAKGQPKLLVDNALDFFRREHFTYTLTPPLLGANDVEQFLFETKAGFCEHYAGAFAFLMRLVGVPSRIVTGYLGGEFNEIGQYYLIRQQDAHAWVEVWLEDSGWVRVDPTAVVAPELTQRGTGANIATEAHNMFSNFKALDSVLRSMRLVMDTINTRWDIWVLSYDMQRQNALLSTIGLGFLDRLGVAIFMLLLAMGSAGILAWALSRYKIDSRDIPVILYQRFCQRLARIGILRPGREGPQDFASRVTRQRPDLALDVNAITTQYISLRYSPRSLPSDLSVLRDLVAAFHPKRLP